MLPVTTYTSYDAVRALIGVDSDELTDAALGTEVFSTALGVALYRETPSHGIGGNGNLTERHAVIAEIESEERTPEEAVVYGLIRFYAACVVADTAMAGLSMYAKRSESDGKASATRFSAESTHRDVVEILRGKMLWALSSLRAVSVIEVVSSLPIMSVVSPELNIIEESVRESS